MANTHIKHFALYEDVGELNNPDFVRMEKIERRSHLYDGNIAPHVNNDLSQLIFVSTGSLLVTIEEQQPIEAPCLTTIPPGAVHGFYLKIILRVTR